MREFYHKYVLKKYSWAVIVQNTITLLEKRGLLGYKIQRDGVDTVACVFACHPFPFEDVSQMPAAVGTDDLRPPSVGIGHLFDRALKGIIEARPSRTRIKLCSRGKERCITLAADIGAILFMIPVFPCKRILRSFVQDDTFFLFVQYIVWHYCLLDCVLL